MEKVRPRCASFIITLLYDIPFVVANSAIDVPNHVTHPKTVLGKFAFLW